MRNYSVTIPFCFIMALSACGSSESTNTDNGANTLTPNVTDNTGSIVSSTTPPVIQTPILQGELSFVRELSFDLDPFIDDQELQRFSNFVISNDGSSVIAEALDDSGQAKAILNVNTNTAELSWLATDIADATRLLFDAENQIIASYGADCTEAAYTATTEASVQTSVLNLSSLIAQDRCIADDARVSANGNVLIFETYAQSELPAEPMDMSLHSYTINTASLNTLPDINLMVDGVELSPLTPIPFGYESILSDDGQAYFAKQWWSGIDTDGNEQKQVGAVLWNTNSNSWVVRGQEDDLRDCSPTMQAGCNPPYFYALSNDGTVQYFSLPTNQLLENGNPAFQFESSVAVAETGSNTPIEITGTGTVRTLNANLDGDLLLLDSASDSTSSASGYGVYQNSSNTLISLSNTLNGCQPSDENDADAQMTDCEYTTQPFSTASDAERFTADGRNLLLRFISRFNENSEQSVEDFIVDFDNNAAYTLPEFYSADPDWVNADASVFVGNTEFPDFDLLIGEL